MHIGEFRVLIANSIRGNEDRLKMYIYFIATFFIIALNNIGSFLHIYFDAKV